MDLQKKLTEVVMNHENQIYRLIAEHILTNKDEFLESNIKTVAIKTNCSTASIVRFCQYLNFQGFNELKWTLKKAQLINHLPTNYVAQDFFKNYQKIKDDTTQAIINLIPEIKQLQASIVQARNTYIFCYNVAYYASKGFVQRMRGLNYKIFLENDLSSIDWYLDTITSNDLIIFITLSGDNQQLLKYCSYTSQNFQTILITGTSFNQPQNLHQMIVLPNQEKELWNVYSLRSQSLQQLWDFLYYKFYKQNF